MMQLSEELTSTENKVAFSRQAYNDAVMGYNTARETFPNVIIANTEMTGPLLTASSADCGTTVCMNAARSEPIMR